MAYINYNANSCNKRTIDCTVRALSTLLKENWDSVYMQLCMMGYEMCDMPSSKAVVNQYLYNRGFRRHICPDRCPFCYTVKEFCNDNPIGNFLLATDSHVVAVIDGDYIDSWDSGNEVPMFYWSEV